MNTLKLSTKPTIIKVNDEKKVFIEIIYIVPSSLKNIDRFKIKLMTRIMGSSSNNYRTLKEFNNALDRNYIIDYRINFGTYINKNAIMFNMTIPKEGIIDEFQLDSAFNIFYDLIFNPYQEDNHFNSERFNWEKNIMLNNIKDEYSSLYEESYEEFKMFLDENEEHYLRKDTERKLIEEADEYNTYDYYLKNIKNNNYFTYIYGGIDNEKEILDKYNKYFKQEEKSFEIDVSRFYIYPYLDYKYKEIKTKYQQSVLNVCYRVKDMKHKDFNILDMLGYFLYSRENNLMFNALRVKNNLVYEVHVNVDDRYGNLTVEVLMDKKDIDTIKKIINETVYSIKDKKVFENCKERLMVSLKYDTLYNMDDPLYEVLEQMKKELKYADTFKYMYNSMKRVKYEDMLEFLNRLFISRELFLEGDNDGKNN